MNECEDCLKHLYHGGNCYGRDNSIHPCLLFEKDPKGHIVFIETDLEIPFGLEIPNINEDCNYYLVGGIDKTIKIILIRAVKWNRSNRGINGLTVSANIKYWSDENGVITSKPKLQLIKGGQQ